MTRVKCADIRNVAFCGHGAAGKTSLADALLVKTGAVTSHPDVNHGTSICDFDPEEKAHQRTIEASLIHFEHGGKRINALDTPGYPDFIGQTIGALRAVDSAAIVINAHSGIEVNTRRVWEEAGKAHIARVIVINKMDEPNIDFPALINDIRETFGTSCVLFNVPLGCGADFRGVASVLHPPADTSGVLVNLDDAHTQLVEAIVQVDEALMERYFAGEEPSDEKVEELLHHSLAEETITPIFCCSAKTGVGLDELLASLEFCCPPPSDIRHTATKDGAEVDVQADPEGPLVAQVFKTRIDPFVQKLSFIRIFSGRLKKDDTIHVSGQRKNSKFGQVLEMQGAEAKPIDCAEAGDIIAVAKMDELHTGNTLGDCELPPIVYPTPMVGLAVSPKSHADEAKLSVSLHKICEEDPTFHLDRDPQTKELVMTGMSELHLAVTREKLHRRDKLDVETKQPKIPFRETIQTPGEGSYRHKKQTGGRGQFGEVHIRMLPFPRSLAPEEFVTKDRFPQMKEFHFDPEHHFLWINSVTGGTIPGNFMPAIEKGFKERLDRGVIAGYRVQDVAVEVHYGKHHDVDSSEAAFKTAGSMAFRNVFQQCKPCLLEPAVKMAITVPENCVGDVYSDMSSRGGRVVGSDPVSGGKLTCIHAEVPLREVTTYARNLQSMSGGQGSFTMDFSHYEAMPANVQQEITSTAKVHEDEDE